MLAYIQELRARAIHWTCCFVLINIPLLYMSSELYTLFAHPFLVAQTALSQQPLLSPGLIATSITAPFTTPCVLALWLGFFLSIPIALYHLWRFIAPALYPHELKGLGWCIGSSIVLFYTGLSVAFFIVCPAVLSFFIQSAPSSVAMMADMESYLDFMLKMLLAFGVAFQMPLLSFMLSYKKVLTPQHLKALRPYGIVGSFTIAMILSPPDVIAQTLLAIPLWGFFELGAFLGFYCHSKMANNSGTVPL